ncbi:hypothetical protein BB561_000399 [Smittium simulii]|uniref:Uncharacterized protein n=1 Tax=Smittium simulii TaxID=133385 RepID=A0A2T9YZI4_9FUNG|nr:hypothetical protein BB561_000399 [Smittium simulii]
MNSDISTLQSIPDTAPKDHCNSASIVEHDHPEHHNADNKLTSSPDHELLTEEQEAIAQNSDGNNSSSIEHDSKCEHHHTTEEEPNDDAELLQGFDKNEEVGIVLAYYPTCASV